MAGFFPLRGFCVYLNRLYMPALMMHPRTLWKKRKWDILFVLFLAYMVLVPQNPVRIYLTKAMGWARIYVERLERKPKDQTPLSAKDWQWLLTDSRHNPLPLESHKGKVILINFWSTGCPPCVAELPSLEGLYRQYGDRVVFLFVSLDNPSRALRFLEKKNIRIPVYFPASQVPPSLYSNMIPTTFIIDKKGRIRSRKTGAMDWQTAKVKRLLDKLLAE